MFPRVILLQWWNNSDVTLGKLASSLMTAPCVNICCCHCWYCAVIWKAPVKLKMLSLCDSNPGVEHLFWKSPRYYCLMISPHNNMVSPSQTSPDVFICWMTIFMTISAGWHQVSLRALWFRRNVSSSLIKHPSDWVEPHLKNWVLLSRQRNSPVACCNTVVFGWFCLVAIVYIF